MRVLFLVVSLLLVLAAAGAVIAVSANPTTIPSGGTTQLGAPAEIDWDGSGLLLPVEAWDWHDGGCGGTFSPSPQAQNPTWTGPGNFTGAPVGRYLQVWLTRAGEDRVIQDVMLSEERAAHTLGVEVLASPNVASVGSDVVAIANVEDSYGHGSPYVTYAWADDQGGTFDVASETEHSAWYHPPADMAATGGIVRLTVTVSCSLEPAVTQSATCVLVVRSDAGGVFSDVPADYWAAPYVELLAAAGVVQGYDDGSYHPEEPVTRAQMAVYLGRVLGLVTPAASAE